MTDYRKIYKDAHGFIPKDESGRTYDIHHIDGDRNNNCIDNLIALSIQDHYNLHWNQGDYGACWLISRKIKLTPQELSELATLAQKARVANGTHPFVDSEFQRTIQQNRIKNGTHNFLGGETQRKVATERAKNKSLPAQIASANGTHPWIGGEQQIALQRERVKNGTHNWLSGETQRISQLKRVANGTHQFVGGGPNKIKVSCLACRKETTLPGLGSNHKHDGSKRKRSIKV